MPKPVREIYEPIARQLEITHARWIVYRTVFGKSERRHELLRQSSPTFFMLADDAMLSQIQMDLAKLGEKRSDTVNLKKLQHRIESQSPPSFSSSLMPLLQRIDNEVGHIVTLRNEYLAHQSLSALTGGDPFHASREAIGIALQLIREVVNAVEVHHFGRPVAYDLIALDDEGNSLVGVLRDGLRYRELWAKGAIPFDDLQHGKWKDA